MSNVQFGTNTPALRKQRLYYTESSVIYAGMPVCYDFDTTTNVLGWDNDASQARGTTTDEGYQNEGKFLRVEDPDTTNIQWFAGVVADGGYCGKTGPKWVDVYEPNGAIVPVRAGVACTVGTTVLSLLNGVQYLGQPLSANQGRPVAIAEETNLALTTPGLILAKLDPSLFIYQAHQGTPLSAAATGVSAIVCNQIDVTTAQTSGAFCAFQVKATSSAGATSSMSGGGGLAAYFSATVSGTVANHVNGVGVQLKITGGTPTEYLAGLHIKVYENSATMTSCSKISALSLEFQVADNVQTYRHAWISLQNNGAQTPDALIHATNLATLNAQAFTGDVTVGSTAGDYAIPVYLQSQPGTQLWYIPLVKALAP